MGIDTHSEMISRMLLTPASEMITFPDVSTFKPLGYTNCALVAGPPSPLLPSTPVPANKVMMPVLLATKRTLWFHPSAKYTLSDTSTVKPNIKLKVALVAGPPSPALLPDAPVPAKVVIMPVRRFTSRIRVVSTMYTLSLESKAME